MKNRVNVIVIIALTIIIATPISCFATFDVKSNASQIIGNGNTVTFIDVPVNYWAKEQIDYFTQQGIVSGYNDGSFKPNEGVTREEFCKLLVSTFKPAMETPSSPTFSDVAANRWSYPYIEVCREFLTGYANPFGGLPTFHPKEYATREDIAVALVRMMGYTDSDANDKNYAKWKFYDGNSISPGVLAYVSLACEKGLISGYPDGNFAPDRGITRAETVVLLNRATKQAVTNMNAELQLAAQVVYSSDKKTATINITAEEGTSVTVNGEAVKMSSNFYNEYEGSYVYAFEKEGSKDFIVEGKRAGKVRSLTVTAKYEVGAPVITLTTCPTSTDRKEVTIKGKVSDINDRNGDINVTVNGKAVYPDYSGNWSKTITLTEGSNTIKVVATNSLGKSTTETRTIEFGVGAPTVVLTTCPTETDKEEVTIKGKVSDINDRNGDINVTVNGEAVYPDYSGYWSKNLYLREGKNSIVVVATNSLGKSATEKRTISFEVPAPTIIIMACPTTTNTEEVIIKGKVSDVNDRSGDINVTVNGNAVYPDYSGTWRETVTLREGTNSIEIVARNSLGKYSKEIVYVTYEIDN